MQYDGLGWLFAPAGLVDGPLPTHYEPHESPVRNPLYGAAGEPGRGTGCAATTATTRRRAPGSKRYPFVFTTYRVTEHHTAGGMSRTLRVLAELQPEMFCEVAPALAAAARPEHGGWATIVTARAAIEARVLVTERIPPLRVGGRAGAPGRPALPLGLQRPRARRRGQRPVPDRARPRRAHPGEQGRDLRHPAGPPAARAGAAPLRRRAPAARDGGGP